VTGGHLARLVVVLLTVFSGLAWAATLEECRQLRQRRDSLAVRAMEEELQLVRAFRAKRCPALSTQAEGANANDQRFTPINYASWNTCRREAERELEASQKVRHRNRQGFTFYTSSGAELARQADQVAATMMAQTCQ
jgi:hypothetical protein